MTVAIQTAPPQYPSIAFVGNCQAGVLAQVFRSIAPDRAAPLVVQSFLPVSNETRTAIREADIVVWQKTNTLSPMGEPDTNGRLVEFPWVAATFLWPNYGPTHINYRADPPFTPYWGSEVGDRFLNRMIRDGCSPEEALWRYLSHDHDPARLDRAYEIAQDHQRIRDTHCGSFHTADLLENLFRRYPLFRTPSHPLAALTGYVAQVTLPRIGLTAAEQKRLDMAGFDQYFPTEERPIHPQVAQHFRIQWAGPDRLYETCQDGSYTFIEWVLRYMRTEICEPIARGFVALNIERDVEKGIALFRQGFAECPRAHRVRDILVRHGALPAP